MAGLGFQTGSKWLVSLLNLSIFGLPWGPPHDRPGTWGGRHENVVNYMGLDRRRQESVAKYVGLYPIDPARQNLNLVNS